MSVPGVVWLHEPQPARPGLSREQIVTAAVALADAEGVGAVSMRRVAEAIGAGTMSLYRHVPGKDELLDLMTDQVLGEIELAGPRADWRATARLHAQQNRQLCLRHRWLADRLMASPPLGPNALAHFEAAITQFRRLGCDITTAAGLAALLRGQVLSMVRQELADQDTWQRTGMTEQEWRHKIGPYIQQVVDSGKYPHFTEFVYEAEDQEHEQRFVFGLECLLDGIAVRLGDQGLRATTP